jgi:hypothetical protein
VSFGEPQPGRLFAAAQRQAQSGRERALRAEPTREAGSFVPFPFLHPGEGPLEVGNRPLVSYAVLGGVENHV